MRTRQSDRILIAGSVNQQTASSRIFISRSSHNIPKILLPNGAGSS